MTAYMREPYLPRGLRQKGSVSAYRARPPRGERERGGIRVGPCERTASVVEHLAGDDVDADAEPDRGDGEDGPERHVAVGVERHAGPDREEERRQHAPQVDVGPQQLALGLVGALPDRRAVVGG